MENKTNCDLGYNGDCCCNCIHQVQINCHPANGNNKAYGFLEDKIKIGYGSINQIFGWGCEIFRKMENTKKDNFITFKDTPHGMCEMHQHK